MMGTIRLKQPRRALHYGIVLGVQMTRIMAEALVLFRGNDIKGALFPEIVVENNTKDALKRWINCCRLSVYVTKCCGPGSLEVGFDFVCL